MIYGNGLLPMAAFIPTDFITLARSRSLTCARLLRPATLLDQAAPSRSLCETVFPGSSLSLDQ